MKRKKMNPALLKVQNGALAAVRKLVCENPILISGLSLGPVVAISQTLKAGVSLSVAFAIIIVPVLVLFAVNPIKIPKSLRVILCALVSSLFFIPAFWFAKNIFPEVSDKVGVFLPLMVVNPIISSRSADASKGYYPLTSLIRGLKTALGFSVVMCLVSAIREIVGNGTIWGMQIGNFKGNISFLLPFMGFILLGFLAAAARKIANITIKSKEEGVE
jgi:electron transport complex protein RnfE